MVTLNIRRREKRIGEREEGRKEKVKRTYDTIFFLSANVCLFLFYFVLLFGLETPLFAAIRKEEKGREGKEA